MNKDQTLLSLASKHFDFATLERSNNSDDFVETARWVVKQALSDAYDAGLKAKATPLAAPTARANIQSQIHAVTDANCTVQAEYGFTGVWSSKKIEVCVDKLEEGRLFIYIHVDQAEDMEHMYETCKALRVDVFKAVVEATLEVKRML